MRKFKWARFFTFLTIGLCLLGGWGYINYLNYIQVEQAAQAQIEVNNELIDSTVYDIEREQMELRMEQRVLVEPPPAPMMSAPVMESPVASAPSRAPASVEPPQYDELQARIDELEAERQDFLEEKGRIAKEIRDVMSLFSVDIKNPMMNIVFLPLIAYILKRLVDFGFARLEERYHHETE